MKWRGNVCCVFVLRSWQLLWSCMPTQAFLLNNPLPFIHTQTVAQKSVPSSHLPLSSIHLWSLLHMTDHSWLWVLSPLLPVFSFLFRIYMLHTHTHTHTRTRTRTHAHAHTHTHTQLPSKAMRLLGWCIVYYKVAGMERPDGSICMSVYEFHLSVSFFWSLLGNVNGVVNKLFIFPFNPVDTKANHIRNPGGFTFLIRVLNENANKIQFYIYI